ncbi:Cyclase-associated protein 1 [Hibiscus syriacus]|uniref:Cyclase-associated protein 1 n=1 Tax=Hibiscus syriacus TaxID=106335 RepID=A0A6A2WZ28_HIBSY|nr:Cyclase-associated protein 1 [Hibiscus syriacus]
MDAKLIERLEAAVAQLEALSARGILESGLPESGVEVFSDPSIMAFDDLMAEYAARVSADAEKIGGQVLDVTKLVLEAFSVQKNRLIEIKQLVTVVFMEILMSSALSVQKPDMAGLVEFLKPLNEVILKVNAMTEGRRSDFFNHLKSAGDSLSALAWIAYTGKDCDYRNKDQNHVEWAKALKELYLPGLRDYVRSHYPLGPVWSASGKRASSAPPKAPPSGAPAPPPPPPASLFSSEPSQPSSSQPKQGMSAVSKKLVVGMSLQKVTADMKTKNRTDRTGVISASEKETRSSSSSFSKAGPPKLELQMGRKKNLVIDDCDAKQSVYIYGCKDSVLQIQGKVNNITIDKCTKMGVVFKDVVAACEIVNCNGVEVQCQVSFFFFLLLA